MSLNLGNQQDAEKYIQTALSHLDGMTERERYTTRGMYYRMTGDYQQCVKEYGDLIARYADVVARNTRLVLHLLARHAESAEEMRRWCRSAETRAVPHQSGAARELRERFQAGNRRRGPRSKRESVEPARWPLPRLDKAADTAAIPISCWEKLHRSGDRALCCVRTGDSPHTKADSRTPLDSRTARPLIWPGSADRAAKPWRWPIPSSRGQKAPGRRRRRAGAREQRRQDSLPGAI